MAYSYFQFIAYEVPTATEEYANGKVRTGFDPDPECAAVNRIPVEATTYDDARKRLKRLASVVDKARRLVPRGRKEKTDTLKVFMAPEFYFRPRLYDADYQHNVYPQIQSEYIFDQLSKMFLHDAFRNWLIVAGTVLWKQVKNHPHTGLPVSFYRNTAVAVRGDEIYGFEKHLPSNIDGVPVPYSPDPQKMAGYDETLKLEYENWMYRKLRVFSIDGVSCGLDICLDHIVAPSHQHPVLKHVLSDWTRFEGREQQQVSLHLLTAGGMEIKSRSVVAKPNGYILRNDGFSNDPYSEMRKVKSYKDDHSNNTTAWDLNGDAKLSGNRNLRAQQTPLVGDRCVQMFGAGYREFPQRLLVYPRKKLP